MTPTCPTRPGLSWALHPKHQRTERALSLSHCCKPRPLSWKRALSLSSFHKFASILIPDSADLHHFHNLVCQCLPNARQGQGLLPSGKQIEPCIRFVKVVKASPFWLGMARAYFLVKTKVLILCIHRQRFPKKRNYQSFLFELFLVQALLRLSGGDKGFKGNEVFHSHQVMIRWNSMKN